MAARILIVDDEPAVVNSLRRVLSLEGYDVVTATDGEAALDCLRTRPLDLIVLDVMLPGVDGFTVCEQVRATSSTPIIMLTARDTVPDRIRGLDRGADDYLVKPFAQGELTARVRALLRRAQPAGKDVLVYAGLAADLELHEAYRDGQPLKLSQREFELVSLFLRYPRKVMSREQICQHVWGYAFGGESNFVDVAIKELRKKLEAGGRPRLLQTIRGAGYALREQ